MEKDLKNKKHPKSRFNCWDVMMCGREEGGNNIAERGVCPAAADRSFDGINSGKFEGIFMSLKDEFRKMVNGLAKKLQTSRHLKNLFSAVL